MGKIKVLHVLGPLNRGGAELRTLEMIEKSNAEKFEFHICTLSEDKGNLEDRIMELGIPIHRIRLDIYFYKKFKRLLEHYKFEVVHAHNYYFSGIPTLIASRCQIPVRIIHFRTTSSRIKPSLVNKIKYGFLRYLVMKYSTNIIGVSNSVLTSICGKNWKENKKVKKIYNGFDINDYIPKKSKSAVLDELNIDENKDIYIHVGSFSEAKNHMKLIRVFNEIVKINKNAHLIIVGSGNRVIEHKIKEYIVENKIKDKVTLTGELASIKDVLNAADIMIFPSLWEGLPGAIIESSILKKPVLSSNINPCVELSDVFPNITTLSLELNDFEWALTAEKLLHSYQKGDVKFLELKETPFYIRGTLKQIHEIWDTL